MEEERNPVSLLSIDNMLVEFEFNFAASASCIFCEIKLLRSTEA